MQISVTTQPQAVFPNGEQDSFVITNRGPATVYADQDTSVSGNSHPIPPTGVMVWDANRPLYMVAGSGDSAVALTRNSSPSLFGNDTDSVIYQKSVPFGITTSPMIECSAYKNLIVLMRNPDMVVAPGAALVNGNLFDINITWYDSNGHKLTLDTPTLPAYWSYPVPSDSAYVRLRIPVKGAFFVIQPNPPVTQSDLLVIGTTRAIDGGMGSGLTDATVHTSPTVDATTLNNQYPDSVILDFSANGTTQTIYLPNYSRNLRVAWGCTGGSTTAGSLNFRDAMNQVAHFSADVPIPVGSSNGHTDVVLPLYQMPCIIYVPPKNAGVALATFYLQLTWS